MLLRKFLKIACASLLFAAADQAVGQTNDVDQRFPEDQFPETQISANKRLIQEKRTKEQEAIRAQQDWFRRRQALIAQGGCDDSVEEKPDICWKEFITNPATLGSISVPRFAAPFQVQLVKSDNWLTPEWMRVYGQGRANWENRHHCGASLIAEDWIVTAAHCFDDTLRPGPDQSSTVKFYGVRLDVDNISQSETKPIAVNQIIIHPKYSRDKRYLNDIALLQIATDNEVLINRDVVEFSQPNRKIQSVNYLEASNQAIVKLSDGKFHAVNVDTGEVILHAPEDAQDESSPTADLIAPEYKLVSIPNGGQGQVMSKNNEGQTLRVLRHFESVEGATRVSKTVGVWNTESGRVDRQFKLDLSPFEAVLVQGGRRLVVWSEFGDVEVWSIEDNDRISSFSAGFDPLFATLKTYDKGRKLFIGNLEGRSHSWNLKDGKLIYESNHSLPVHDIKVTPDNKYFVTRSNFGTAEVRRLKSGEAMIRVFHGDQITGAKLIKKQKLLMTWGDEGFVKFWSLANGKEIGRVLATMPGDGFTENSNFPNLIEIVTVSDTENDIKQAEAVTVTGWGKTRPVRGAEPAAVLGMVGLEPLSRDDCLMKTGWSPDVIQEEMAFCAADKQRKTCYGDSGGPVIADKKLVGIVSWGSGKCKEDEEPGVYTKVPTYYPWIKETICQQASIAYPNPKICGRW